MHTDVVSVLDLLRHGVLIAKRRCALLQSGVAESLSHRMRLRGAYTDCIHTWTEKESARKRDSDRERERENTTLPLSPPLSLSLFLSLSLSLSHICGHVAPCPVEVFRELHQPPAFKIPASELNTMPGFLLLTA